MTNAIQCFYCVTQFKEIKCNLFMHGADWNDPKPKIPYGFGDFICTMYKRPKTQKPPGFCPPRFYRLVQTSAVCTRCHRLRHGPVPGKQRRNCRITSVSDRIRHVWRAVQMYTVFRQVCWEKFMVGERHANSGRGPRSPVMPHGNTSIAPAADPTFPIG